MLKEILSVHGEHGLFRLVSQTTKMVIVESIKDGKRKPFFLDKKIISLNDVAIYTDSKECPLWKVLETIKTQQQGTPLAIDTKKAIISSFDTTSTVNAPKAYIKYQLTPMPIISLIK